jgi:hypothetical protein
MKFSSVTFLLFECRLRFIECILQRRLLAEVDSFNNRVAPIFETVRTQAAVIEDLQSELSLAHESITQLTLEASRVTALEAQIRNLKTQLKDARHVTDKAVELAEEAKNAAMVARHETELCLKKAEEDQRAKENMQDEMRQLKCWLDGHQKEVRYILRRFLFKTIY